MFQLISRKKFLPQQFLRDNFIFIHIPKAAGSSFLDRYLGYQLGHISYKEYLRYYPHFTKSAFSCAFVREPISRFVSAYNFIHTCRSWPYLEEYSELISSRSSSLDDLARNIHVHKEILNLAWFRPQHSYLSTRGSAISVTRVFKTEEFDQSIDWLCSNCCLSLKSVSAINQRSVNNSVHGPQDLSSEGIRNLTKVYCKDLTLFGYY